MICPYRSALIMRNRKSMPVPFITTKFHKPTTLSYAFKLITELKGGIFIHIAYTEPKIYEPPK
jgi:hypothetical protein